MSYNKDFSQLIYKDNGSNMLLKKKKRKGIPWTRVPLMLE